MRLRYAIALASLMAASGVTNVSVAQVAAQPEPRVFTAIEITGNRRFDDRDILATSGLSTGVELGESELEAAMEALYWTGEFERVRISSRGSTLLVDVEEEAGFQGGLTFGAGFDSDAGVIGYAGIDVRDAFAPGVVLSGRLEVSRDYRELSFGIAQPDLFREGFGAGLRLSAVDADDPDDLFSYRDIELSPYLSYSLNEATTAELRYIYRVTDIHSVNATASPIIAAEAGELTASGIGFGFETGGRRGGFAWGLNFDQEFLGLGGDTSLSFTRLRLNGRAPIGSGGFVVRSLLDAGHVEGRDGDTSRITDRFVLGGASLRGFEGASVSPRDVTGGGSQVLGGTDFAVLRTDLVVPIFRERPNLETFVFYDVGSVWGLDSTVAPAGTLNSDQLWRSSAGVGVSLDTEFGRFEAYYALTTDEQPNDEGRAFGLTIRSEF